MVFLPQPAEHLVSDRTPAADESDDHSSTSSSLTPARTPDSVGSHPSNELGHDRAASFDDVAIMIV
jgi:hypothetical protein